MANLGNVVQLTQTQYDTLITNGSITVGGVTYTYDANNLYLVDEDTWHTEYINTSAKSISALKSNATYLMELYSPEGNYGGFVNLGLVTLDSSSSSSTRPITVLGVDPYSSATYGRLVRFEAYLSSNVWTIAVKVGTSITSFSSNMTYYLRFKRVNI